MAGRYWKKCVAVQKLRMKANYKVGSTGSELSNAYFPSSSLISAELFIEKVMFYLPPTETPC